MLPLAQFLGLSIIGVAMVELRTGGLREGMLKWRQ